jgi:predicted CXXCH cytochrome family protein
MLIRILCLMFLTGLSPVGLFTDLNAQSNSCIACHAELENELAAPVEAFKSDIHWQYKLTCVDCHGGNDSEEDFDSAKDSTFKGAPDRVLIPQFCGSCHSNSLYMHRYNPNIRVDQLVLYKTSEHGKLLDRGDQKVAVCTDCHGMHGILSSINPRSSTYPWNIPKTCGKCHSNKEYMKNYSISTQQVDDYEKSVHAYALFEKKNLSAPVCNDCHGNHSAAPPGVKAVSFVCRQCHPMTAKLFLESPHSDAFEMIGELECEACHGNHQIVAPSDNMLGTGAESVCIQCHDPESLGYQMAHTLRTRLEGFKGKIQDARELLQKADNQGVEVSDSKFKLQEVNTLLIQVRNQVHSVSLDEIDEKIKKGNVILKEVMAAGNDAVDEANFRKRGLLIATLFVFLLAVALFFKIRQIERAGSE